MSTYVIVMGDIISKDGKNASEAFAAASNIFNRIQAETPNCKFAFLPGNHDYCGSSLDRFNMFANRNSWACAYFCQL